MTLERVLGVLLLLGFLIGGTAFAAQYFGARGQIEELENQRDGLVVAFSTLQSLADSARARGDSLLEIAEENDRLSAANVELVEALADTVEVIVERIVEMVPDSVADMVRRVQEVSEQRVDSAEARADRAEAEADSVWALLFDERDLHDQALANARSQIQNLERQRDLALAMAPGNFLQEILDDPVVLAVGTVIGGAACYAWCPR